MSILALVSCTLPTPRLAADVTMGMEIWGDAPQDAFGSSVSLIADVNNDNIADIAVGAFNILEASPVLKALSDRPSHPGYIRILSGRDGSHLKTIREKNESLALGVSVLGVGDLDGDGCGDLAAAAADIGSATTINPFSDGVSYVKFYSGKTGALLKELRADFFADVKLAPLGDIDGDGVNDTLCAFCRGTGGEVWVISGKTLERVRRIKNDKRGFGCSVSAVPDVDKDLCFDIAVGAMVEDQDARGEVFIFSGKTGNQLASIPGHEVGDSFGCAVLGIGDVDKDGAGDLLIGARRAQRDGHLTGAVYVYSSTGSRRHTVSGSDPDTGFGSVIAQCGDVSGDGSADIAIASWSSKKHKSGEGCTKLYSSADWSLVCELPGNAPATMPFGVGSTAFDVVVAAPRLQEPDIARGVVRGFHVKSK